jgi:hypothetical protein
MNSPHEAKLSDNLTIAHRQSGLFLVAQSGRKTAVTKPRLGGKALI